MDKCNTTALYEPINEEQLFLKQKANTLIFFIGISFIIKAIGLSFYLIYKHATNYTKPNQQKHIIRILLLIPVYGITSCLSIKLYHEHVYLEATNAFYEAIALVSFFTHMCNYLAPDIRSLKDFARDLKLKKWILPLRMFKSPRSGLTWLNIIWIGVFQYCLIRILLSIATYITEAAGIYCYSERSLKFASIWVQIIEGISLTIAMTLLMDFYFQLKGLLAPHNAVLKFASIKLIIFITLVQKIVFSNVTGDSGPVKPSAKLSKITWEFAIPNALICIELFGIAVLHLYAFPWKPYAAAVASDCSSAIEFKDSEHDSATFPESPMNKGGKFGGTAYKEALNLWDMIKATGRGLRWLFVGHRNRNKAYQHPLS